MRTLVLALALSLATAAWAADTDLVRNPGFEEGHYPPIFWTRPVSGGYQFAVDEKVRHAGKHSLRMTGLVDDAWRHWAQTDIPARPGETYTFGAWVKTDKVAVGKDGLGALVLAVAYDDADRVLATARTSCVVGTTDWTLCEATLTAPEAASHLTIRLELCRASGTAWFDDAFIHSPSASGNQRAKPKLVVLKPTLGAYDAEAAKRRTGSGVEPRTIRIRAEDCLSPEQADAALARAKSAQANTLVCHANPDGRLMFPNALLPMPRSVPQDHDPLGYLVAQAHKEGIQVIPAFSVFALARLAAEHPDWEVVSADGKLSDDWRRWACPAKTEARAFLVSMVLDVLRYDVDGIALDDVRYPDGDYCYCDFCRARFRRQYGVDPLDIAKNPDKLRSRNEAFRVYLLPFGSEQQARPAQRFVGGMAESAKLSDLKRPGVLVCSDLSATDATAEMVEAMAAYVREGGHLVFLDGPVGVGDKFSKFRELVGAAGNCRWLPADVSLRRDADHPLVADLPDASFSAAGHSLTTPTTATVLASFGHVPAILLNKYGSGQVILFNFRVQGSPACQALFTRSLDWLAEQSGAKLGKGKLHAARQAWDKWRADQLAEFVAKVREGLTKQRRDVPLLTSSSPEL